MKPKPTSENAATAISGHESVMASAAPALVMASEARPSMTSADASPNPAEGGSYTLDPATGELTCATPATADRPAMRKVQDPVTGAITRVPFTPAQPE